MSQPRTFQLKVAESAIADLHARLAITRFPDQAPGAAWAYGTDLEWMRNLVAYWRHGFDWRLAEARLNSFEQFTLPIAGIDLHYLHVKGIGAAPMPLLLAHGWPGSVFEFMELIPRLTDPVRYGGSADDAFTVVAPSLPGFGLSFAPGQPRLSIEEMSDAFATLMTEVLGYRRFGTQGGDWGASIASRLGFAYPESVAGVHLNLLPLRRHPALVTGDGPAERQYLVELKRWLSEETGYSTQQATRPQTLAYALTDSPAGLAAWIVEKMRAWSDCGGDVERAFSKDELLANISLYWFTGAIGSSFWPYYARHHGPWPIPDGQTVDVPMGYCEFPAEIVRPPRSLAALTYSNIQRWSVMPRGGHFAAMEQPDLLAEEIRAFYRPLRTG